MEIVERNEICQCSACGEVYVLAHQGMNRFFCSPQCEAFVDDLMNESEDHRCIGCDKKIKNPYDFCIECTEEIYSPKHAADDLPF